MAPSFLLVCLVLAASCQRKAPGPSECREFARKALGIRNQGVLNDPRVRARYDQLTDACLTTPYDRQLVRCVAELGPNQQCFVAFQKRQEERGVDKKPKGSE